MPVAFRGETYNDDRMYVVHVARCTVGIEGASTVTTVYHETPPDGCTWCVVTYKNVAQYRATRIDHFPTLEAAQRHRELVEPQTPLVSLGGKSPGRPMGYKDYVLWKAGQGMRDFDYRRVFSKDGSHAREIIVSRGNIHA